MHSSCMHAAMWRSYIRWLSQVFLACGMLVAGMEQSLPALLATASACPSLLLSMLPTMAAWVTVPCQGGFHGWQMPFSQSCRLPNHSRTSTHDPDVFASVQCTPEDWRVQLAMPFFALIDFLLSRQRIARALFNWFRSPNTLRKVLSVSMLFSDMNAAGSLKQHRCSRAGHVSHARLLHPASGRQSVLGSWLTAHICFERQGC